MSTVSDAWARLDATASAAGRKPLVSLFDEPGRLERLTLAAPAMTLDLSKQAWDGAGVDAALALARAAGIDAARERPLFAGVVPVNRLRRGRPALHMAFRAPDGAEFYAYDEPVSPAVEASRRSLHRFAEGVRTGQVAAADGKLFTAVLHIGIGGSDLGPRLVWEALKPLNPQIDVRFVANVDGADIAAATAALDPARTLVIVVSKTFTTQETMTNARAARAWLAGALGEVNVGPHLAAVSTNLAETAKFGVADHRVFGFWDWVGGRYSLWSAVGLSCAIGLGWAAFQGLLDGAAAMDEHFRTAPLEINAPVMLALSHIFNRNGLGRPIRAVVPYAQRLRLFPAHLQQLEMESNGKRVESRGRAIAHATAAGVFGDAGTNGQHAFFPGMPCTRATDIDPYVEFIAAAKRRLRARPPTRPCCCWPTAWPRPRP